MKILIAEDDPISCRILAANLRKWGHDVVVTHNGHDAWQALHTQGAPSLAILDRMMPDVDGIEICRQLRREKTDTPVHVILLTSLNRREDLLEGLEAGADDYLTKPLDTHELRARLQAAARILELQESLRQRVRELEAAIAERKLAEEALRNLSLTDQLTGLYNYRGFLNLAEHHAKTSRRSHTRSLLIYADMDGLKEINDTLGHRAGSTAINATAGILRRTFRECDIIARLGGDEFAVLVPDIKHAASTTLLERLEHNLRSYNDEGRHEFTIALSIGAVEIDHEEGLNIEDQMARADEVMYREKRKKKGLTEVALKV
ncbi:MAG TPA: diguanylate cyclase [Pyrinomonadaceae bacterium]|jgi:diguanylate cyclase (GGDEF)-like protein|nr:diguanylate cyclase [Pyrinomonadaceae bacterium]